MKNLSPQEFTAEVLAIQPTRGTIETDELSHQVFQKLEPFLTPETPQSVANYLEGIPKMTPAVARNCLQALTAVMNATARSNSGHTLELKLPTFQSAPNELLADLFGVRAKISFKGDKVPRAGTKHLQSQYDTCRLIPGVTLTEVELDLSACPYKNVVLGHNSTSTTVGVFGIGSTSSRLERLTLGSRSSRGIFFVNGYDPNLIVNAGEKSKESTFKFDSPTPPKVSIPSNFNTESIFGQYSESSIFKINRDNGAYPKSLTGSSSSELWTDQGVAHTLPENCRRLVFLHGYQAGQKDAGLLFNLSSVI